MALFVLLVAILSRVVPHLLHTPGANVTAVDAALLCFGSRLRPSKLWVAALPVAALAATDWWLTTYAYGYPFHPSAYLLTWLWYGVVVVCAAAWLHRRHSALRIAVAAVCSSSGFFLFSNGLVWLHGNMYPHNAEGLAACYTAGLPFYRNDLASTLVFSAVFFSLPFAARVLTGAARSLYSDDAGLV